jgi:hypothetical protein
VWGTFRKNTVNHNTPLLAIITACRVKYMKYKIYVLQILAFFSASFITDFDKNERFLAQLLAPGAAYSWEAYIMCINFNQAYQVNSLKETICKTVLVSFM